MIAVIYGGAGSGKSSYAEKLLLSLSEGRRIYLATMMKKGAEDEKIIERHKKQRDGMGFETIEKPFGIHETYIPEECGVLLEDIPNLVSNELFSYNGICEKEEAYDRIVNGLDHLSMAARDLVIVTGNVFEDGISYGEMTEIYMELLGDINMYLAKICDVFAEITCGYPVFYKGKTDI